MHAVSVVRGKITHYSGVCDYMGSMVSTVAVVRGLGYCVQKAVTAQQDNPCKGISNGGTAPLDGVCIFLIAINQR